MPANCVRSVTRAQHSMQKSPAVLPIVPAGIGTGRPAVMRSVPENAPDAPPNFACAVTIFGEPEVIDHVIPFTSLKLVD